MGSGLYKYLMLALLVPAGFLVSEAVGESNITEQTLHEEPLLLYEPVTFEYQDPELHNLVDTSANNIIDPEGTLTPLMEKLFATRNGRDSVISIVHIGDSHVQAGFWTNRIRHHLQSAFGNAGRGLILPYKMGGMNEPTNYGIIGMQRAITAKATSNPFDGKLSFTGMGVGFESPYPGFRIWSKEPFDAVTVFHHIQAPVLRPDEVMLPGTYCDIDNTPTATRIVLNRHVDTLYVNGLATFGYDVPLYYGFSLENGNPGVLYHDIGANGAAFEHFSANTDICDGGATALSPDLLVISLGTNNSYGRNYRTAQLRGVIEKFVSSVMANYPGVPVILTTPRESCRRSGGKYTPNPNIAATAALIREIANEYGLACWDFYSAAGGKNIAEEWFKKGLSGRDRIHLSEKGYTFAGDMFFGAFAKYYNEWLVAAGSQPDDSPISADSPAEAEVSNTHSLTNER